MTSTIMQRTIEPLSHFPWRSTAFTKPDFPVMFLHRLLIAFVVIRFPEKNTSFQTVCYTITPGVDTILYNIYKLWLNFRLL